MTVSVTIKPAGKPVKIAKGLPTVLTFPSTAQTLTVEQIKVALKQKYPRFSVDRQKLTLEDSKAALSDEKTVAEVFFNDLGKGAELAKSQGDAEITFTVKDLGPQISWKTVFLIEYAGPLVIHPLVYHLPNVFYGLFGSTDFVKSDVQKAVYAMVMAHFIKRELETLFVHRFSHATMPFRNVFKNSAHYHLLSGVLLAGGIYGPWYSASALANSQLSTLPWIAGWSTLFVVAELLNLSTHITLRNLRPAGTKTRAIPRGGLFELVSCPNYTTEILAWTAVAGLTLSPFAGLFVAVSGIQMILWAIKKHKAYKKEFGTTYPKRKVIFPFIF